MYKDLCLPDTAYKGWVKMFFIIRLNNGLVKKMPGISSHFDHPTGHHMMGQQLLTLGLSCGDGFVPLDNELRNFSYKKYWNHVFSR